MQKITVWPIKTTNSLVQIIAVNRMMLQSPVTKQVKYDNVMK